MTEDKSLLAEARAEFKKLAAKGLAAGALTALSAVMGILAVWIKGLGNLGRGMLWGSAATLLVLAVLLVVLGLLQRGKARKLASISAPLPAVPETVPQERVERLRELYATWGPTVQFACECLWVDICHVGEKGSQDKRYLAWLVNHYVARPCSDDKYRLDTKFQPLTEPTTKAAFDELLELLSNVINSRYRDTIHAILEAGEAILGKETLLASSWYSTLYERHQEGLRELSRIRARPDIGGISSWQRTLGELLPPPTKSGQEP